MKSKTIRISLLLAASTVCVVAPSSFYAQSTTETTVLPIGFANVSGGNNDTPFEGAEDLQQLFRASTIQPEWSTPVLITGIAFRVATGAGGPNDATIGSIDIRLSTSSRAPEQMTTDYNVNKGPDEIDVYSHSNVHLVARSDPPVNPFDLKFVFDQPFVYDPTRGNLLIRLSTRGTSPFGSTIDAHSYAGPSGLSASPAAAAGLSGVIPNRVVAFGVISQFTFVSIPEPSSFALLSIGLGGLTFSLIGKNKLSRK